MFMKPGLGPFNIPAPDESINDRYPSLIREPNPKYRPDR